MITRRRLIRLAGAIVAGCVSVWLCAPHLASAEVTDDAARHGEG